jgi:hypothetical protein
MPTQSTAARPQQRNDAHWYKTNGDPCYELPKADGKGTKVPTITDAKKLNLVPSVTSILKLLDKPALTTWLIEQAVLAVVTSPRKPGEADDAYVYRILHVEMEQDKERRFAADKGTAIHNALELYFTGQKDLIGKEILPWIEPAALAIAGTGELVAAEKCLVGDGYAGRTDLILRNLQGWHVWDWKSSKNLPDPAKGGAYAEHRLQLSAYGNAFLSELPEEERQRRIYVGNVYISTVECGKFLILETPDWLETYERGFRPLVEHWQWAKGYAPVQDVPF